MIQLKLLLPTEVLIDEPVSKVSVETQKGAVTLLPRHIDFVALLVPGILSFVADDESPNYLAVSEGVLVKRGFDIQISVRNAVRGDELATLWETVMENFRRLDERERKARAVIASLESTLARQIALIGSDEL